MSRHNASDSGFAKMKAAVRTISRSSVLSFVIPAALSLVLNVLAGWIVHPVPVNHDEYAYLLGADTFVRQRLTNPTHPLSEHFATYQVIVSPTYQSKYPPGQSLSIAFGVWLFGSPIAGVWITLALATGLTTWMLRAWLPHRWAFYGGLLLAANPMILMRWGQTFWGGGVALAGGALVLGALRRILKTQSPRDATLLGMGLIVLANSRPFEGLVVAVPCALLLLGWMIRQGANSFPRLFVRVCLPATLVLAIGFAGMFLYNKEVTGSGLMLPYQVWMRQQGTEISKMLTSTLQSRREGMAIYGANPDDPRVAQSLHDEWARHMEHRRSNLAVVLKLQRQFDVYDGWLLLPGLLMLPCLLKDRWRLFAFSVSALMIIVICGNVAGGFAHYTAPAAPLFYYLGLEGVRALQCLRGRLSALTRIYYLILPVTVCVRLALMIAMMLVKGELAAGRDWARFRENVRAELVSTPGDDVVFVRYELGHTINQEWVYNSAEIDASSVIWARDLGVENNADVMRYYPQRKFWLLSVKNSQFDLMPYEEYLNNRKSHQNGVTSSSQ